jgi:hypothetical protein
MNRRSGNYQNSLSEIMQSKTAMKWQGAEKSRSPVEIKHEGEWSNRSKWYHSKGLSHSVFVSRSACFPRCLHLIAGQEDKGDTRRPGRNGPSRL